MLEAVRAAHSTRRNQEAVFVLVVRDRYVVREFLNRQRPFGNVDWQAEEVSIYGLGSTLRPRGRLRTEKRSSLAPF
jgi:hypothetical protein